jgi:alkanesulfonate monooxygenase SsuD/methylene tetrahydromethanopterin reductase-like flavin-dependent oxidoreductase (luciferase family)
MLLPLHHPIELAEQIATLDVLTGGRVEVVFGLGYVPREFAMFDVKRADRVSLIESGVELVRTALSDAEFTYSGAPARVTPAPCQRPHPPLYLGGGVEASALRAARLRVGFAPQVRFDELTALYKAECGRLRQAPGPVIQTPVAYSVFVAEDPEELWTRLARHVRHNANSYSAMTSDGQIASPFAEILHPDDEIGLRERGGSRVVTPDQFVDLAVSSANSGRMIQFVPLLAGLDPDIAWQSLELISARVLPRLKEMNLM